MYDVEKKGEINSSFFVKSIFIAKYLIKNHFDEIFADKPILYPLYRFFVTTNEVSTCQ